LIEKKFKILSLTTTYPDSKNSIQPSFVHILNKEFVSQGHVVSVITPHVKNSLKKETIDEVKINRFQYLPEDWQVNSLSLPNAVKTKSGSIKVSILILVFLIKTISFVIKNKPDVIHAQWAFPAGVIGKIASIFCGAKSITSCHGAELPLLKKFYFIRKITVFFLNHSNIIAAVSNFTKNELISLGILREKIARVNATPFFVEHKNSLEELKKFKTRISSENKRIILFLGRLVERKGVIYLLRSIPLIKSPDVKVVIAGGGIELNNLKKTANQLKLENKVYFFESPSQEERSKLYDISDVFVCSSIIDSTGETEAIPTVIPEAMESNLPVIGTSVGGIPDIIEHQKNGILVPQKNPKLLANSIDLVLNDVQLRETIIKNSKETVKMFLPSSIAKNFINIFKKC